MGQRPAIIINRLDAERLQRLIDNASEKDMAVAQLLEEELARGEVCDPEDIPDDVVSMNSQVRFTDLTRGLKMIRTLVYPHSLESAALIGLKVGDIIEWPLPNNTEARLRIDAIYWQPEREKQFHR